MSSPATPSRVSPLCTAWGAFDALTALLCASMVWAARAESGLEPSVGVLGTVVLGAAVGWIGTECLLVTTADAREASK